MVIILLRIQYRYQEKFLNEKLEGAHKKLIKGILAIEKQHDEKKKKQAVLYEREQKRNKNINQKSAMQMFDSILKKAPSGISSTGNLDENIADIDQSNS